MTRSAGNWPYSYLNKTKLDILLIQNAADSTYIPCRRPKYSHFKKKSPHFSKIIDSDLVKISSLLLKL